MSDFGTELARLMALRGVGVRQLARAVYVNSGHVSKLRSGSARPSPELAAALDGYLGGGGTLSALGAARPAARRQSSAQAPSRAVEALRVAVNGEQGDGADIAAENLAELIVHYAHVVAVEPSEVVYDELVGVRSFAGTLLGRGAPSARAELAVTAGWLSSLLAISATDLGDHAAAVVWCADAARRGRAAGHPELAGWAALTRALIAWYQGDPARSAAAARRGQADTAAGTAAYAKLASQEMRSLAMLGDTTGMTAARRRAAAALARLDPDGAASGVYSIARAADPPYTATSLLVTGRHTEAAGMTRQIIATTYAPQARPPSGMPTAYARTLLILALAVAGLGEIDEAAAVGAAALDSGRLVWPTMVLAGKLDESLTGQSPRSPHAIEFRARFADAGTRLALPAGSNGGNPDE